MKGKSHDFSLAAVETCRTFSSYGGDGLSKLMFVQRSQDSCLVVRDTSGIATWLGKRIRTLLEVRLETKSPFRVATVI